MTLGRLRTTCEFVSEENQGDLTEMSLVYCAVAHTTSGDCPKAAVRWIMSIQPADGYVSQEIREEFAHLSAPFPPTLGS